MVYPVRIRVKDGSLSKPIETREKFKEVVKAIIKANDLLDILELASPKEDPMEDVVDKLEEVASKNDGVVTIDDIGKAWEQTVLEGIEQF